MPAVHAVHAVALLFDAKDPAAQGNAALRPVEAKKPGPAAVQEELPTVAE